MSSPFESDARFLGYVGESYSTVDDAVLSIESESDDSDGFADDRDYWADPRNRTPGKMAEDRLACELKEFKRSSIPRISAGYSVMALIASSAGNPYATAVAALYGRFRRFDVPNLSTPAMQNFTSAFRNLSGNVYDLSNGSDRRSGNL